MGLARQTDPSSNSQLVLLWCVTSTEEVVMVFARSFLTLSSFLTVFFKKIIGSSILHFLLAFPGCSDGQEPKGGVWVSPPPLHKWFQSSEPQALQVEDTGWQQQPGHMLLVVTGGKSVGDKVIKTSPLQPGEEPARAKSFIALTPDENPGAQPHYRQSWIGTQHWMLCCPCRKCSS